MAGAWTGPRTFALDGLLETADRLRTRLVAQAKGATSVEDSSQPLLEEFARRLGGRGALDRPVLLEASSALEEQLAAGALEPRARLAAGPVQWLDDTLSFLAVSLRIRSRSLTRFFQGPALPEEEREFEPDSPFFPGLAPQQAALFVVTIGSGFESAARQAMARDSLLTGFLLDALGSTLADAAAAEATRIAADLLGPRPPDAVPRRYCVGFGDWALQAQADLFEVLAPESIGVTLNEAYLMTPEKSVAGLIAWKVRVNPRPSQDR